MGLAGLPAPGPDTRIVVTVAPTFAVGLAVVGASGVVGLATLVAVGSHSHRRAAGILLGSVATAMLHEAPASVLIARESERFPERIVVDVPFTPRCQEWNAREVWHSGNEESGSFPNLVAEEAFLFAAGGRVIFASEQDGWAHLYSVSDQGGKETLLTPGQFEFEDVALSADRKSVVYTSNQNDVDRRHVWRVPVAGGTPQALSRGETIGGIMVWRELPDVFTQTELDFLVSVARQTAIAIESARLYLETQRRATEMSALAEVGREISSSLEPAVVLEKIATRAKELLAAPGERDARGGNHGADPGNGFRLIERPRQVCPSRRARRIAVRR